MFYVQASGGTFTSTGSDCCTACKYFEAAPSDQGAVMWATTAAVCYNVGSSSSHNSCQANSIYSGDSDAQTASRTASTSIGMGMANTNQIYARLTTQGEVATANYAAGIAWAYSNNGKTDWHLPSKNEVNQLCKWQGGLSWTSDATVCSSGTLNSGTNASGFSTRQYWNSSEISASLASAQLFPFGNQSTGLAKNTTAAGIRPVRAFS